MFVIHHGIESITPDHIIQLDKSNEELLLNIVFSDTGWVVKYFNYRNCVEDRQSLMLMLDVGCRNRNKADWCPSINSKVGTRQFPIQK